MSAKDKLKVVKGGRPSTRKKRIKPDTRRIVFIPREGGGIACVDGDTFYALTIDAPVVVTVPEEIVGYERLGDG